MKTIQACSLVVIAILLAGEFTLSHIWPAIYLRLHHGEYYDAAVACTKAATSYRDARQTPDDISVQAKKRLILASLVQLADCRQRDLFKNKLLANGVDRADVKLIEIEALDDETVPLDAFVESYFRGDR